MQRGIFAGGWDGSPSNVIDYITFSSRANAVDFGDLTVGRGYGDYATSQSNSGIEEFQPRAPELYSPTGKVVPRGSGVGNVGLIVGGEDASGNNLTRVEVLNISTLGNSINFGDMVVGARDMACASSSTRLVRGGGRAPGISNKIESIEISTKGNGAEFGDLTAAEKEGGAASSSTRGVRFGGRTEVSPNYTNVMDYITIATTGNATDFGDLSAARKGATGMSNQVRAIAAGGNEGSTVNTMEYITIDSTGNTTDYGDLISVRTNGVGVTNGHGGLTGG